MVAGPVLNDGPREDAMRLYEVVYIFNADLDEAAVNEKLTALHALVTAGDGAEVAAVDHWGTRQMAYPIQKSRTGYYVVSHFRASADSLPEYERALTLDDDVLRYLLVLNEGEPTSGLSTFRPVRPGADFDDDDDDDHRRRPAPAPEVVPEARGESEEGEESDDEGPKATDSDRPPEFSGGRGRRRRVEGPPVEQLNYKDVSTLSQFMTEQGKILPKRTTKVTAGFQRQLGRAIKRARYLALVPYVRDHDA
ncbi:MAG: hypothetical protein BMS9Abin29_0495 [Gemmatimonadota bacterium]|nr:MAG: hypothetical protein BMS9Abin29_0495 [Gemmatimonadota bacterium]